MSIDHSQTPVTLTVNGKEIQFGRLRPKDLLDVVEWANARVREEALRLIPTTTVEERIKVFRETRNFYSIDTLGDLLGDPVCLAECLFRCYRRHNAEATREEFDDLFGALDLPMLEVFFDAVSGMAGKETDPTPAAAESAAKNTDSAKPLPPSVNPTN